MECEWRAIPGHDGYEVSFDGKVRSLNRESYDGRLLVGKNLAIRKSKDGYMMVKIMVDGVGKTFRVHRLVAMAFVPNPENKPQINHIDNNRANNLVSNLEWATNYENCMHKCRQNRQNRPNGESNPFYGKSGNLNWMVRNKGVNNPCFGGKNKAAREVLDTQTGIYYDCVKDAAIARGINPGTLATRLHGQRKNKTGIVFIGESKIKKSA